MRLGTVRGSGDTALLKTLVVDDNPMLLKTLVRQLGARGHDVVAADSCAAARAYQGPFDLAVLDLNLGDGCGVDLARALLGDDSGLRVVFFSASGDERLIMEAELLGSVARKPNFSQLLELIDEVRSAAAACAGSTTTPPAMFEVAD